MVIQHNIAGMNANRQLNITTNLQAKSSEKLSSGYKINRAADDAAGLAISEKMRRQVRGLTQASENAQDGISLVQIADGAMAEVHEMLQRGNELAVQAANDTLTETDRGYIQAEIDKIKEEIDAINGKTTFNEKYILRGKDTDSIDNSVEIVGGLPSFVTIDSASENSGYMASTYTNAAYYWISSTADPDVYNMAGPVEINHSSTNLTFPSYLTEEQKDELVGNGFYFTCCTCNKHYSIKFTDGESGVTSSGNHYIYNVDISNVITGSDVVQAIISATGSNPQNHYTMLDGRGNTLYIYDDRSKDSMDDVKQRIADLRASDLGSYEIAKLKWTDYTSADGTLSYEQWKNPSHAQASTSVGLFGKGYAVSAAEEKAKGGDIILQVGSETDSQNQIVIELPYISSSSCHISGVSVMSHELAKQAIESFKDGLMYVSEERSRMGAYQNRLEHTIKNLDNVVENTQSAESLIRDTDMAAEMVKYSNNNILAQAGQSMLAQANQTNQGVLSLLQ